MERAHDALKSVINARNGQEGVIGDENDAWKSDERRSNVVEFRRLLLAQKGHDSRRRDVDGQKRRQNATSIVIQARMQGFRVSRRSLASFLPQCHSSSNMRNTGQC